MRLLFVFVIHFLTAASYAQVGSIHGMVVDSSGTPLPNVSVSIKSISDSLTSKTNNHGVYRFENVVAGKYILSISDIGFENYSQEFTLENKGSKSVSIDPIKLSIKIKELPGLLLTSTNPITIKEDTIEYRTDAYKVREGALVEDVLKKLPGLTVSKDGVVTAQGKEVSRVRVNGKDYFGGDVKTATQNLPASIVENVQIIDDHGDKANLTGIKAGESEKILNINIKKGKNKGNFGSATIAAGTEGRYLASLSANKFDDEKQLSMLGSLNNINASGFEFSAGDRGSNTRSGNNAGSAGVTDVTSLGLNYRDLWGKKITAYGSYSYSSRNSFTTGTSFQQDFNPANINSIQSNNESHSKSYNHRFTWNLEYQIDTLNYLKLTPFLTRASSENTYKGNAAYAKPNYFTLNNGRSRTLDAAPAWGTDVFYLRKFRKQGRNFSLTGTINHSSRDQERDVQNTFYNVDSSFTTPLASETDQNQLIENNNVNTTTNYRFSFAEPLGKFTTLEATYVRNNANSKTTRDVNDVDQMTGEKIRNMSQSNEYNYQFITNRIGLNFYTNKKKYNYYLGMAGQPSVLTGTDDRRHLSTRHSNFNLIPSARVAYKFSRNNSLSVSYNGSSREPGFNQLQPVTDSSNLKNLITGNPYLKAEFTNRFRLQYNKVDILTGRSFFTNISFDETQNKIVSSRINDATSTGRTITYLNTNGFYGLNGNVSLSQPFRKKRFALSVTGSASYDNNISFTDNQKNRGNNWTVRPGANLRIDLPDLLDLNIGGNYVFNKNTTRYQGYSYTSKVQTLTFGFDGKNYFLKDWTLGYDLTRNIYMGYQRSFNNNPTLLNLYIERRFLKNNKGRLRLQGFDLFDENSGISRSINGTTITDVQNNRLSRYFMVSFNLRMQRFVGK